MRILISWLRDFVDVPVGPGELADMLSMRGFELAAVEPAPDGAEDGTDTERLDAVLDLEITANRPDCLSIVGIAREVATAYGLPLRELGPSAPLARRTLTLTPTDTAEVGVTLEEPELCPRYAAAVVQVAQATSPAWMTRRLVAAGVRPIDPIVDVTNYVLIELGHPTHAFDLDRLAARQLHIRRAAPGEPLTTLDGERRTLTREMLVIADAERAQAVAGVMGGADSEVGTGTRRVVLESAYFEPTSVRRTSKQLGLKTEASARFERGADIGAPVRALERASALLVQLGAGQPLGQVVDRYPAPPSPRSIPLRQSRIHVILGQPVDPTEVDTTLTGLGFTVARRAATDDIVRDVGVPSWRVDVFREIDLIEEVGRHHGYDRLPATFPALARPTGAPDPRIERDRLLRRVLAAGGFSEAATFTFIGQAAARRFSAEADLVPIANPLSEKFAVLRPSLVPGLVEAVAHNRHREQRDVRLFEIGVRFTRTEGEGRVVGLVWTGAAALEHWSDAGRTVDFHDVTGVVERLCLALGVAVRFAPVGRDDLVEGRAAAVTTVELWGEPRNASREDGPILGRLGHLDPSIVEAYGLRAQDEIYMAELDLDALQGLTTSAGDSVQVQPLPRYPSIVRDVSIVVDETLPAGTVRDTIRAAAPDTLVSVAEFDRYQGKGMPERHVSLSLRLTFRSPDRTLTDDEIQRAVDAILAELERAHGAHLRR